MGWRAYYDRSNCLSDFFFGLLGTQSDIIHSSLSLNVIITKGKDMERQRCGSHSAIMVASIRLAVPKNHIEDKILG